MLPTVIAATRVGGSVALLGYVGGTSVTLYLLAVIRRAVTLHAVSGGSRTSFEELVRFLEMHELRPIVDARFPFDQLRAAHKYLGDRIPLGKVIIDFEQPRGAP